MTSSSTYSRTCSTTLPVLDGVEQNSTTSSGKIFHLSNIAKAFTCNNRIIAESCKFGIGG